VDLDDGALDGLVALADDEVLDPELERDVAVGLVDLRAFEWGGRAGDARIVEDARGAGTIDACAPAERSLSRCARLRWQQAPPRRAERGRLSRRGPRRPTRCTAPCSQA
jgi:hypothetical protein